MMIKTAAAQQQITNNPYRAVQRDKEEQYKERSKEQTQADSLAKEEMTGAVQDFRMPENSGGNNKIRASMPDDNVGQLASELANCQTKLDVQQVSSKAMRALANLRMAGALSEGKDKEKIAQMIRRMQKLIKRVRIKMKNLTKEEELQNRQKKAEEERKEQEARQIRDELRNRRNKRQREERDYAIKESVGGSREAAAENILPGAAAGTPSMPTMSGGNGGSVSMADAGSVSVDAGVALAAEGVSLDVTV